MELKFVKFNPTENMTILVESPVPRKEQPELAARLLAYSSVNAEQVGYIEDVSPEAAAKGAQAHLQMAAGEFCGMASMSLAALVCLDKGLSGEQNICLEVSGAKEPVQCALKMEESSSAAAARVAMPPVLSVEEKTLAAGGQKIKANLAVMEGISHIIVNADTLGFSELQRRSTAEKAIRTWEDEIKADALGVLLIKEEADDILMEPLVYVPGVSLVWEHGCGSGSTCLGAYLACREKKAVSVNVKQPGGTIKIDADYNNGNPGKVTITGKTALVCRGTAYI
jgi:diaminopimelate epimerase